MDSFHDPKGYYKILGLTPNSSEIEIRKAYKQSAKVFLKNSY